MFYPVRVFSKSGKLKKEVSSQSLSRNYWSKIFDPARKNIQISVQGISKKDRVKLGWELDDNNFSED
jgi:hypothetical protein